MKTWALRFALCALFAIGLFLNASAQIPAELTKPGVIKAGKVEGEVYRVTATGETTALKAGDTLIETDTITTAKKSSVVLVFMNGSSVKLDAETKLQIAEFKMDPLAEDIEIGKLTSEPTVSKTKLKLAYGEMVGDVKKLNKGSSYGIETPVGAAGIRGTTFRIVFRPSDDGRSFTFQLQTASGNVVFEGSAQAPANVSVPENQEIAFTAEATVDTSTGQVTVTSVTIPTTTTALSQTDATKIAQTAQTEIQAAAATIKITTTEMQSSAATQTTTPPGDSGSGSSSSSTKQEQSSTTSESSSTTTASESSAPPTTSSSQSSTASTTTVSPSTTPSPNTPAAPTTRPPTLTQGAGSPGT